MSNILSWDILWSTAMIITNIVNFILALIIFKKSSNWSKKEPEHSKYLFYLRIMGITFISIALYRSVFVSSYPNRLAWHNTILNSPFVIRSLATFAEMSFIGMIAIILNKINNKFPFNSNKIIYKFLEKTPSLAVLCIFIAQFLAFAGLITQYLILFALEEALWGIAFLLITPFVILKLIQTRKQTIDKSFKIFLTVMTVWCIGYCIFQWGIALPFIHFAELSLDIGRVIPNDALKIAIFDFTVSRNFESWGGLGFFIWHSGYFSLCVWMSLLFMNAPRESTTRTSQ